MILQPELASTETPMAPVPSARRVRVWCDDETQRSRWSRALMAEGLQVEAVAVDPVQRGGAAPDAWVLHLSGGLAPQLPRLRALRTQQPQPPLVVALRGLRELDQVLALEMGADDVIDTAWSAPVVAARLRALWRRTEAGNGGSEPAELNFGRLRLSRFERRAWWRDGVVPLTEGEFAVLWLLASRAGSPVARSEILRRVRGLEHHPLDRSIDSRVYRLRAKLGDAERDEPRIRTVRNVGYVFVPMGW